MGKTHIMVKFLVENKRINTLSYMADGDYDPSELIDECGTIRLMGQNLKCRKGVEFGARIYNFIPHGGEIPPKLVAFLKQNKIPTNENTQVVAHYYKPGGSIGAHTDKVGKLVKNSKIYSISFLLGVGTSIMEWTHDNYICKQRIKDKEFIVWDATEHHQKKIKHSVKYSGHRINITIRQRQPL